MSAMDAASACASRAVEAVGVEAGPTTSRFAFFPQALDWKTEAPQEQNPHDGIAKAKLVTSGSSHEPSRAVLASA